MITTENLSEIFVEMADSLVDAFDLVGFLHDVTTRAVEVSGAATAGLLLADQHDVLHVMAASSNSGRLLELFQLQSEQGAIGRARGIDVEAAFEILRAQARSNRQPLREVALAVLDDPTSDGARQLLGPA
ncbi:MAG: ANTAR domain-containing protein [Nocardioidaceae bacterium]|nr:ANTAR domain-containing protein [Nocardioidaceae bacterium]